MKRGSSKAVSSLSSSTTLSELLQSQPSTSSDKPQSFSPAAGGVEDLPVFMRNGCTDRRGEYLTAHEFPRIRARGKALRKMNFEAGGYDWCLLVYPKGDSQALPGNISIYLEIMGPRGTSSSKWDCFASYRLAIVDLSDDSKSIRRDSWHRFSSTEKKHGWCDFTPSSTVFDRKLGYLFKNESVLITADILILNESVKFTRDNNELQSPSMISSSVVAGPVSDVLSGKFTWKVHNFSLFKEMIKTQKIMSPVFPAGECNLRISVYQSSVNGHEYLSMCLESKDMEKSKKKVISDRSCCCLFRMSMLNKKPGSSNMHRDSYGRFAADNKSGDNTSLEWNDYMKMADFLGADSGFLVDDTAVFSTSFHVIKELSSLSKNGGLIGGGARKSDGHMGKFTWKIDNFTRLIDLLKKRKITGLCIKSRRFQIGNRDCRLIVYPRGQSQPPCHLSVFLEVMDSWNTSSDWSCFVSHRLSVVNQRMEEKSVTKESQNRYSKAAKDWGWPEFVTLTSLFDQDSGFLIQDTVVFSAEVLILKETSILQDFTDQDTKSTNASSQIDKVGKRSSFTWKVENFLSFKKIMETRRIFSNFFQAGGCELRIGVYESFDTIFIYLESDQSVVSDPDKFFWVRYRMAVVNQKNPDKNVWKESSIFTETWNNSVLQFMKVSDMLKSDAGFLMGNTVVFVCEILDCCPFFEFSDLEVRNRLSTAVFHPTYGDDPSQPQVTLREKLQMDAGAIAGFLTGLRVYLDDPTKAKRLLLPTKLSGNNDGKKVTKSDESSPSVMNLLMGVQVLQQAIIDLLLDIMVECCRPSEGSSHGDSSDANSKPSLDGNGGARPLESDRENGAKESAQFPLYERLDSGVDDSSSTSAVQSSDMNGINVPEKAVPGQPISPPETSAVGFSESASLRSKTKWPEQSEELLGLIVNSLRALDGAVPQGCPEPRRRPQSAQKISLVLDKAPKHLQPDLVALVPKLVEHSEHPLAAYALLERLQKPDAEPALRISVFGALSHLECGNEVWERVLLQSLELLTDSNDEPLAATIDFIFGAASMCQRLPEAVRSVRVRLKYLGAEVSPCVLDFLSKTVNSWRDVAETILRDIDCDDDFGDNCSTMPCGLILFGENGCSSERLHAVDEQAFIASCHFSDIYILIEMLSIPCLAVEAAQTFERAVVRGTIVAQSVAMVLERRLAQRLNLNARIVAENFQHVDVVEGEASEQLRVQRDDFSYVLGLAESLALSKDLCVRGFVKMLYTILLKWYPDESYRVRMLKRLIDRAITSTESSREVDLDLETLVILVCEEQEIVRPVLSMMREVSEVAKLANVDRAALWHQLCASEDEIIRMCKERKAETSNMAREKAVISQKLSESEATNSRLKSEMRTEMDRFVPEKKELSEHIQEIESQLDWICSERDDEITKVASEKKVLQDRLHDAETQLSQLKPRKRDELKTLVKDNTSLFERLKSTEAERKRLDEELAERKRLDELKWYAMENVTPEEIYQQPEDEVRRLTQTVEQTQTEGVTREQIDIDDLPEWKTLDELKWYATENVTPEEIYQQPEDEVRRSTQTVEQTQTEGVTWEQIDIDDLPEWKTLDELKWYATENVTPEEIYQQPEYEVRRLTQTVEQTQTEGVTRELKCYATENWTPEEIIEQFVLKVVADRFNRRKQLSKLKLKE